MIGMFINTVPTRVDIPDAATTVLSWLRDMQTEQVESRRFDFVSLAQLQAWSDLPAGINLFDSIVVFENYPIDDDGRRAAHGLQMRDVAGGARPPTIPLTLVASPRSSSCRLQSGL